MRQNAAQAVSARGLDGARTVANDRLLIAPVFVMSPPRSGSTLLRSMLTCHSQLHAPHELHLKDLRIRYTNKYIEPAMLALGQNQETLKYLLWDRLLHHELLRHDKNVLVNKTPDDVLMWWRVVECWPDARFIFLLRNPAVIANSWGKVNRTWDRQRVVDDTANYLSAFNAAYDAHGGLLVRYEDLTENPQHELDRICDFVGVEFEARMLNYAGTDKAHTPGLGDWSARLRSGQVASRKGESAPGPMPPEFADYARRWGY